MQLHLHLRMLHLPTLVPVHQASAISAFLSKRGRPVGIIGGTGSGKSTLVNLIARFYDASQGTVRIDGQDIRSYSQQTLRQKIGVVPQRAALFKGTIRENMKWGRDDATDAEIWDALTTARHVRLSRGKTDSLISDWNRTAAIFPAVRSSVLPLHAPLSKNLNF